MHSLYHCGEDCLNGVWKHIANGVYGAVVHPEVEKLAKECYLSFGEINNTDKGLFGGNYEPTKSLILLNFYRINRIWILTNASAHRDISSIGEEDKD